MKFFSKLKSVITILGFAVLLMVFLNQLVISTPQTYAANSNSNTVKAILGANANIPDAKVVTPAKISNPVGTDSLLGVGTKLIKFLLGLIVIVAVIAIVIAGFRMITGGANPSQIAQAKRAIIWAIVGLAVALFSFAIIEMVNTFIAK